jgi:hypothetical protein
VSKTFKIVNGDLSDGYHTFDELYDHRCLLFLNLCLLDPDNCRWKTDDFEGWFCLYWESPKGQISYHLPNKLLKTVRGKIKRHQLHEWDGHTSKDVVTRLGQLARSRK